ncbi:MAG: TIGR04190 family B12-binding domain/radical SAM domain protein [Kiritimatiellae bacterium]|nr:TIGR04190 family B12-binding domain/radical SAM domain protein [Kiritimatiellia bacterium]
MNEPDLILLHAPSVFDFRQRRMLYGPVSDVVPSTQVFEMYPIGFLTMLAYLQQHGLNVRIINVALKMLRSRRFNVEKLIKTLRPAAFGLDLHWLVHAQGSLELANRLKEAHPGIPVIFGGLSASYFHEELIRYPQVDHVLRGDSTEEPLRRLLAAIKAGAGFGDIPNLTWKEGAAVRVNPCSHIPADLDALSFDYRKIMRACARYFDFFGHLPFKMWLKYPIVAALSCRGCVHNCTICGGGAAAYVRTCERRAPAYRGPERLAADIGLIARYIKGPVIVLGDILQAGLEHGYAFLRALKRHAVRNHIAFEFFYPPPREFLAAIQDAVPNYNIQMSPESHDERVRYAFGRRYDNAALERSIFDALQLGCRRFDVFFMIGIPEQTPESVRATIDYCAELMGRARRLGYAKCIHPYISPLAPFLDPGSNAFEEPERFGYTLFCRTLEEHRQAQLAPSWKYTLSYETRWMSRSQIVEATYDAALALNALKREHGLITAREAERLARRTARERALMEQIDAVCERAGPRLQDAALRDLMDRFETTGPATICKKDEMNWPSRLIRFHPLRVLRSALSGGEDG